MRLNVYDAVFIVLQRNETCWVVDRRFCTAASVDGVSVSVPYRLSIQSVHSRGIVREWQWIFESTTMSHCQSFLENTTM